MDKSFDTDSESGGTQSPLPVARIEPLDHAFSSPDDSNLPMDIDLSEIIEKLNSNSSVVPVGPLATIAGANSATLSDGSLSSMPPITITSTQGNETRCIQINPEMFITECTFYPVMQASNSSMNSSSAGSLPSATSVEPVQEQFGRTRAVTKREAELKQSTASTFNHGQANPTKKLAVFYQGAHYLIIPTNEATVSPSFTLPIPIAASGSTEEAQLSNALESDEHPKTIAQDGEGSPLMNCGQIVEVEVNNSAATSGQHLSPADSQNPANESQFPDNNEHRSTYNGNDQDQYGSNQNQSSNYVSLEHDYSIPIDQPGWSESIPTNQLAQTPRQNSINTTTISLLSSIPSHDNMPKPSEIGKIVGKLSGCVNVICNEASLFNESDAELTGELFGLFEVGTRSAWFSRHFNGNQKALSKSEYHGKVFEGRFVGYFGGTINRDVSIPNMYKLSGTFGGCLIGRFVGILNDESNEETTTTSLTKPPPLSTVYSLSRPPRIIFPNLDANDLDISGELFGLLRIDKLQFDSLKSIDKFEGNMTELNLNGTFDVTCTGLFHGLFEGERLVLARRTFNGTVFDGQYEGKFCGSVKCFEIENTYYLYGSFNGTLSGPSVGRLMTNQTVDLAAVHEQVDVGIQCNLQASSPPRNRLLARTQSETLSICEITIQDNDSEENPSDLAGTSELNIASINETNTVDNAAFSTADGLQGPKSSQISMDNQSNASIQIINLEDDDDDDEEEEEIPVPLAKNRRIETTEYRTDEQPGTSGQSQGVEFPKPIPPIKKIITVSLKCPECKNNFKKFEFDLHRFEEHGIPQYRCLVRDCGRSFSNKRGIFQCPECMVTTDFFRNAKNHYRWQHQELLFCKHGLCGFSSKDRSTFRKHELTHNE